MQAYEVNFDGLIGNTHNYAGLSYGNIASEAHVGKVSYPRDAALQGLAKCKALHDLGVKQAILPPHERPDLPTLRALGFRGSEREIIESCARSHPELLVRLSSASAMWAANAATMAPSVDTADGRVHLTPANLNHKFHRSVEARITQRQLQSIFRDPQYFMVHAPLPGAEYYADEGAANHTRFCADYASPGVHLFVYGRSSFRGSRHRPKSFPARQTREACAALARRHQLDFSQVVLAQQHPDAIDAGVFHNDVISVGNGPLFLYHQQAFLDQEHVLRELREKFEHISGQSLIEVEVSAEELSLEDAVSSYLFNSQLIQISPAKMLLVAPTECSENQRVRHCIERILADQNNPLQEVLYIDVRQSMQNGGGPACLRQRIVLTEEELQAMHPHVFLTDALYARLVQWVKQHYRETLEPRDLQDPQLYYETESALNELCDVMDLGPVYDYQRVFVEVEI